MYFQETVESLDRAHGMTQVVLQTETIKIIVFSCYLKH